jgi:hypothetical protein
MSWIRDRLSYANVMATIAVFLTLGGGAFAAIHLKKNSVTSSAIKKNAVTSVKIKNGAVTNAKLAKGAVTAGKIGNGQVGQAQLTPLSYQNATLTSGSSNSGNPAPQFGKDALGIVHLRGVVGSVTLGTAIFTLPSGFRPPQAETFPAIGGFSSHCEIDISPAGTVTPFGPAGCNALLITLDGITFST